MVTSNLETFVGEAGAFGELCLPLKNPGYLPPPPLKSIFGTMKNPSPGLNHISFCQKKRALDYKLARGDVFN